MRRDRIGLVEIERCVARGEAPFNPFEGNGYERSARDTIRQFQERLRERGLVATTRKTRGDDIDAACGQLAGKVSDRIRVRLRDKKPKVASA